MGRTHVVLKDKREIVLGLDKPFATFFAQLFAADNHNDDRPDCAVGYHPAEQSIAQLRGGDKSKHGPYPVTSYTALLLYMHEEWGVDPDELPGEIT